MTAAEIKRYINTGVPGMEVVRLEADDAQTYKSRKFKYVQAAFICWNEDNEDKDLNVVNSAGTEIDGTSQTVKLNIEDETDETVTLVLFGRG